MGLLTGKRGLVFGIINDRSYAWCITKQLAAHGAECAFTHFPGEKMEKRVHLALEELQIKNAWVKPCDVSKDEDLDTLFAKVAADFQKIDFIVHSVAFADRNYLKMGMFHLTPRAVWTQALDVSAYSLLAMGQRAVKVMPDGGSIISMTYFGGEKVIPGYNVMGVAKAALEHTTRYLAAELGEKKIRVNTISGGPIRTLASSGVGGIDEMMEHYKRKAPLKGESDFGDEAGRASVFLVSDLGAGVTGETIHVDAGFSIIGL